MKIKLMTVYENVNEDWLEWYIERLREGRVPIDFERLKAGQYVSHSSKEPDGDVVATTSYRVDKSTDHEIPQSNGDEA